MNQLVAAFAARPFIERYVGSTILAIGAHPDDLELGVGGTLARFARAGAHVIMAVASVPNDFDTRTAEARKAAAILGCELRFLQDGTKRIEDLKQYQLVGMIDALVRETMPAAVISHNATEFHRDHVAVYDATVSAQRLRFFDFYSFQPTMCRPMHVPFQPRAYVDVSETIEAKLAAINAHESQFGSRGIDTECHRDYARMQGRMVGVKYAEGLDVGRMLLA